MVLYMICSPGLAVVSDCVLGKVGCMLWVGTSFTFDGKPAAIAVMVSHVTNLILMDDCVMCRWF